MPAGLPHVRGFSESDEFFSRGPRMEERNHKENASQKRESERPSRGLP
jgi:hypothetical protein